MQGATFLIGIIILFFALWLVGGGPDRPIALQGPYLTPIERTGDTADAYGGNREAGTPGVIGDWWSDAGESIASGDASSVRGSVTLGTSITGPTNDDPDEEYVVLRASGAGNVTITGWKLVSEATGVTLVIPGGTERVRTGSVNQAAAITLSPGQEAVIVTGRSPVGASFRENLCTGYLDEHQGFTPPLDASCPLPWDEFDRYGNDDRECESFVASIPSCTTETRVPSELSSSCERFIEERLTYNGCVATHGSDPYFLLDTWRVFIGQRSPAFGDDRDTIKLLDAEGKVVDVLSY